MRKVGFFLVIGLLLTSLTWAEGRREAGERGPIVIKQLTYQINENPGARWQDVWRETFNEKYEGTYRVEVESIDEMQYMNKVKQLYLQNALRAPVQATDEAWFEEVVIPQDGFVDLREFFDEYPELLEYVSDEELEKVTLDDGRIATLPSFGERPIGFIYNDKMYSPRKPIQEMSHAEFARSLGDLEVAFMTAENAWTTGLYLTALLAAEPGGAAYLNAHPQQKMTDYNNDIWINAITKLQSFALEYGYDGMVGAAYADAANAFMGGDPDVAFIANGPWMFPSFAPDGSDNWSGDFDGSQVKASPYPGNIAFNNGRVWNDFLPSTIPEEQLEAWYAWLAHINSIEMLEEKAKYDGTINPLIPHTDEFKRAVAENQWINSMAQAMNEDTVMVPHLYGVLPEVIGNDEFPKLVSQLLTDAITPEEFCATLTQKAKDLTF